MTDSVDRPSQPSKAEELFYFLKKLAGAKNVIDIEEVLPHLVPTPSARTTFYARLKQLEERGTIEQIMDITYTRPRISQIRFLKQEVSLPQGKRGRKPKAVAPTVSPVSVRKPAPAAPLPSSIPSLPPPAVLVSTAPQGVVVFIDENQIIVTENEGRKFDTYAILEKIRKQAGEKIERVFIYCSEATERRNSVAFQSLFRLDNPLIRVVKTGSQSGVVDKRIREDMNLWSRIDLVSTIVLATSDGGPDFVEAISNVKLSGKKFVLLKTGGYFNNTLRQLADGRLIDASTLSLRRRPFAEIVSAAEDGNFWPDDQNSQFVLAMAMGLKNFFKSGKEAHFAQILEHAQRTIRARREFDGFTNEDVREALDALVHKGHLLTGRKEQGSSRFCLSSRCKLLEVLEKSVPARSQA